jgi:hypothetical protein
VEKKLTGGALAHEQRADDHAAPDVQAHDVFAGTNGDRRSTNTLPLHAR